LTSRACKETALRRTITPFKKSGTHHVSQGDGRAKPIPNRRERKFDHRSGGEGIPGLPGYGFGGEGVSLDGKKCGNKPLDSGGGVNQWREEREGISCLPTREKICFGGTDGW